MAETIEETYESAVTRKVVRTSLKIEEKSSSTKTTTMTTPATLYGRDLSAYDEVDVDELLAKLSQEELTMLAKEVDPDDNFLPPSQRNNYDCEKDPTGPLNRKKLIEHINKQALETPDRPEIKPYVAGVVRGKKWIPPPAPEKVRDADEQISIDLGDEYEQALTDASQEEIIDLAAILGFHSMMNQDQYHASLLNKGQPVGLGWDGITKATKPKVYPMDPPNDTDPDETIKRVQQNDQKLTDLNWNNIKNISEEKFEKLFEGLKSNTSLEVLSLVNVGLNDRGAALLADALRVNSALRVVNVETNFISPPALLELVRALLDTHAVEEFRASNQRSQVLGNKIEMEITSLVEQNPTLLRLGLHLEYSDARHRIASHLQRNIDRNCRVLKKASASLSARRPRGPPPAVGIDSSFFNMTPPSAEALTPTTEEPKPVISETVETSLTVKTKAQPDDRPTSITIGDGKLEPETPVTNTQPVEPVTTETVAPTDNVQPVPSEDRLAGEPVPVAPEGKVEESSDALSLSPGEEERFVKATPPDVNPNPHSTPAATEPEQRLEP
ncbi:tropomodulin-1 isoform X2 [Spodoptera frugiperda]|uniref:Tropomodulin-1 isoform X2 n=1 Tax=Spodoptera frugiperda TaxID=7108 RepID=A0A9R0EBX2_SPOFR|nr:tropomodulin-1 isoform X2 [Spodoptera frugiperda]